VKALAIAFVAAALASTAAAQPKLAPVNEAGYRQLIAAHKGRVVLINFWATWCKPCRAEMPDLVKLAERLQAKGLDMVSISADDAEQEPEARKYMAATKVPGPLFIKNAADDDKFHASIDAKWMGELPALILYDRTGKKVQAFLGEKPVKDLEAAIVKLL
jgi:thiol-disulfide isomerase/thioredoxin